MKQRIPSVATIAVVKPVKRTPRDADLEVTHLSSVLRTVALSNINVATLGPTYWRARLREIEDQYSLLPPQRARLAALNHEIDMLEQLQTSEAPSSRARVAA